MMKKWFKRVVAVSLVSVLAVGILAGCGKKTGGRNEGLDAGGEDVSYPVDTEIELSWFVHSHNLLQASYVSAEESPFHAGLTDQTGIAIDWIFPAAGADGTTTFNLLLQEEELPHILSGSMFSATEAADMLEDGIIIDLTPYVKKYAPDYWAYITAPENELEYRELTTDDGKLWGFGMFSESLKNQTYSGPVIRKDWLDECGLQEPVTLDDWENVLKTFKQKYGAVMSFALDRYNGAGIASGTGAFANLDFRVYVDDEGVSHIANDTEEWRDMLEVLNRWYDMGLIDKDFATNTDTTVRAKVLRGEVGVSVTAMSQITVWMEDAASRNMSAKWAGIEYPRTKAGAPTSFINTEQTKWYASSAAVITNRCTESEIIAACKLLNYGFTQEGILYWNYGTEGVSYTISAEGKPVFTDLITKHPLGATEAFKQYTGAWSSGVTIQQFDMVAQKNAPEAVEAVEKWITNTESPQHKGYASVIEAENRDKATDITASLSTYISEEALKFVTGQTELTDANWKKYKQGLKDYGADDYMKMLNEARERAKNKELVRE